MFQRFQDVGPAKQPAPPKPEAAPSPHPAVVRAALASQNTTALTDLKVSIHQKLLSVINLSAIEELSRGEFARQLRGVVKELLDKEAVALNAQEFTHLIEELIDEVLGLGPLEPFLKDPTVSDILVNTHEHVFVERFGKLETTTARFKDEKHLMRIIQRMVSAVGRRIDESQPFVDARLPDGTRINALVPPCAVDGPLLSLRKFSKQPFNLDRLVEHNALTPAMADFLSKVVRARLNVIVAGGTGSGKTTMLNALSTCIGERERILTIEDTAELQLQQVHVGRLETRPANVEGQGEVSIRDLVKNALRMRPDRIVVGEVRGAEVFDMLQAMNTGHDGSMTTIHANTPRDAVTRLENMIAMSGVEMPISAVRNQVASAVHLVIQLQRLSDGARKVVSIQEVVGMEGDIVTMQEIFAYRRRGLDPQGRVLGGHEPTGVRSKYTRYLKERGLELPGSMFEKPGDAGAFNHV